MNRLLRNLTILASAALIARRFVGITKVAGNSMFPELHDGDIILLDRMAYEGKEPKRGDVVVFERPGAESKLLVKRVIGLPGDHIMIRGGNVSVNDEKIFDDFTAERTTNGDLDIKVPAGRYFMLGDNRLHSNDSRSPAIGCVPRESLSGKVSVRLYPPGTVFNRVGATLPDESIGTAAVRKDRDQTLGL